MIPLHYKTIIGVLLDFGFVDESVKGSHRAFRHAGFGTLILFSDVHEDNDLIRDEDLVSVRRHLVENRLVSVDGF
jgi:predicted RNA binding protein YcfA (HicA-like mRNA interferase family)